MNDSSLEIRQIFFNSFCRIQSWLQVLILTDAPQVIFQKAFRQKWRDFSVAKFSICKINSGIGDIFQTSQFFQPDLFEQAPFSSRKIESLSNYRNDSGKL